MQRIRGLGSDADVRSKWRSAHVRLPSNAGALCDEAPRLVGRTSVFRGLLVGKRGSRTRFRWSRLLDLLQSQPSWDRNWSGDAVVLQQVLSALGSHRVSEEPRPDSRGTTNSLRDAGSTTG